VTVGTYWLWELTATLLSALCRCCWLGGMRCFGAHSGRRGAGAYYGGRPPTVCFNLLSFITVWNWFLVQKGKGHGHTEENSSVRFHMISPNNWTLRYQIWYVSVMTLRYPVIDVGVKVTAWKWMPVYARAILHTLLTFSRWCDHMLTVCPGCYWTLLFTDLLTEHCCRWVWTWQFWLRV